MFQTTLSKSCHIQGIGLHTGEPVRLTLLPAPPDTGLVFRILPEKVEIPARWDCVVSTRLNTTLGKKGKEVKTVEHLLAALRGMEIDNAVIETSGAELPALDGSAQPYVSMMREAGVEVQQVPRAWIRILRPVTVEETGRFAGLFPAPEPSFQAAIDFDHPAIGSQIYRLILNAEAFASEIAPARTFGFEADIQQLKADGLGRGAGLENAVGLGVDGAVMNPEGLRFENEFVRHKILDAVGDITLAGSPIWGAYRNIKAGHEMNHRLLEALFAQPAAWTKEVMEPTLKATAS